MDCDEIMDDRWSSREGWRIWPREFWEYFLCRKELELRGVKVKSCGIEDLDEESELFFEGTWVDV